MTLLVLRLVRRRGRATGSGGYGGRDRREETDSGELVVCEEKLFTGLLALHGRRRQAVPR